MSENTMDFKSVIGKEEVIDHLTTAVVQKKVSHAYIFQGEDGSGKLLVAKLFAKALQCEKNRKALAEGKELTDINPCGECASCRKAESGSHPDIHILTHEKVSIGVDDIRIQINQDIEIKPYESDYKIYIVPDAERMTEQAQNGLLKTIEEPPEYAVILLLTDNIYRLLPTIQSRCVNIPFKPVPPEKIKKYLMEQHHVPDYLAETSARFSQGNIGRAVRYAVNEDFLEAKEEVMHLLRYLDEMTLHEIVASIRKLATRKGEINDYIDLMLLWYRDVLMLKVTNNPNLLIYRQEIKWISEQAKTRSYENIEAIIEAMETAKMRIRANVNFDTAIELMVLKIKDSKQ
jgi:DNA polymerase-3 subunit delta'